MPNDKGDCASNASVATQRTMQVVWVPTSRKARTMRRATPESDRGRQSITGNPHRK